MKALFNTCAALALSIGIASAQADTAKWTVYDYNPSGHALAPRVAPGSQPATNSNGTVSFPFKPNVYTALLTTNDRGLTGDLSNKTLTVTVTVTGGNGIFIDQNGGGCQPNNKTVRFYFASPAASATTGSGTRGFYTQFWWSNPINVPLTTDPQGSMMISQALNAPGAWSDWYGKPGNNDIETQAAFNTAIHNVQSVGLSFGGGCFFENGVTTSDGGGVFTSFFTETP